MKKVTIAVSGVSTNANQSEKLLLRKTIGLSRPCFSRTVFFLLEFPPLFTKWKQHDSVERVSVVRFYLFFFLEVINLFHKTCFSKPHLVIIFFILPFYENKMADPFNSQVDPFQVDDGWQVVFVLETGKISESCHYLYIDFGALIIKKTQWISGSFSKLELGLSIIYSNLFHDWIEVEHKKITNDIK